MSLKKASDQELIRAYLNGNEVAFGHLLNRHKDRIFTAIYMFVKDRSKADDLFQDTFIKIIRTLKKGTYNEEGKFLPWALRIAHNLCIDNFRKKQRKPSIQQSGEEFDIFTVINSNEDSAETKMIKSETHSKMQTLLEVLPLEQREVVVLRHYAELSFKEIADLTNVSINTALGRMRYALINLRKHIDEKAIAIR